MRNLLVHVLVSALVLGFPAALRAGDLQWIGQSGEKKWQPHLEISGRVGNDDRYALEFDPFIPILQDDKSLVFLNIRNNLFWVNSRDGYELNAGLGYRRIIDDRWILGGYGYYDRIDSRFGNIFNQGTLGLEALSLDWDLRLNGYIAEDDAEDAPGAGRAAIDLVGNRLAMRPGVEQALSGFDGEVGWRLPFDPDSLLGDTRLYAGGFFFDGSDVSSIGGPSTRFEMRIHDLPYLSQGSRITLGTEYRWDDVRDSQVTAMLGLRIPFGAPSAPNSLTHLERRMTDRVVRDVSIVTTVGRGGREPVRNPAGLVIADVYYFEDSGDGDGSFDDPFDLGDAIAAGGENALLIGLDSAGFVQSSETLLDGQTAMGGGTSLLLRGAGSGQPAFFTALGAPAILSDPGVVLTLARNNTISGLRFGDSGTGLRLDQSGGESITSILGNTFWVQDTALDVNITDGARLTLNVVGNSFQELGTAIDFAGRNTFDVTLRVWNNEFSDLGGDTGILANLTPDGSFGPSTFDFSVIGNTFTNAGVAIEVNVDASGSEDYTHRTTIVQNEFSESDVDYTLDFIADGASGFNDVDIHVFENTSFFANGHSLRIDFDDVDDGHIALAVHDNVIDEAGGDGMRIGVDEATDSRIAIFDNEITNSGNHAIQIDVEESGNRDGHSLTIANNRIVSSGEHAIDIDFGGGHDASVAIARNTVEDTDLGDGIRVNIDGNGHDAGPEVFIFENRVEDADDDGIDVEFTDDRDTRLVVSDNIVERSGDRGIEIDFDINGHDGGNAVEITRNIVRDGDGDGIHLGASDSRDVTATIAHNTVEDAGGAGIFVGFWGGGHADGNTASISGNTVTDTDFYGIHVDVYDSNYGDVVTVSKNSLSETSQLGGSGIGVHVFDSSVAEATIESNDVRNPGGDGIGAWAVRSSNALLSRRR